jgi:hypothetical protein
MQKKTVIGTQWRVYFLCYLLSPSISVLLLYNHGIVTNPTSRRDALEKLQMLGCLIAAAAAAAE